MDGEDENSPNNTANEPKVLHTSAYGEDCPQVPPRRPISDLVLVDFRLISGFISNFEPVLGWSSWAVSGAAPPPKAGRGGRAKKH